LVTGAAGFIGFNLCKRLIENGKEIIGFDNFNDYYDPLLKRARYNFLLKLASERKIKLNFVENHLENLNSLEEIFNNYKPIKVVNLAAQAGVRYSIENPSSYIQSNIVGFGNILECCKKYNVKNLIYASSSSVYGGNENVPFSESKGVDHPISLYAASKRTNELMAHTYSHLFNIPSTGLRFFTVYGPWGRPDMALFLFTKAILSGEPIKVFNNGEMIRDFTYVDDIVESLTRLLDKPSLPNKNFDKKHPDPSSSWAPHKIFNIGNSCSVPLMKYIESLENTLGLKAKKIFEPIQPGDVKETLANTSSLEKWIDFKPNTSIEFGIKKFVEWYKLYYNY
tara:strand:+ start:57 stop:1070 length:1014 start_codon:yes stop_codon:yes gene_type:complete